MSLTVTEAQAVCDVLAALDPDSSSAGAPSDARLVEAVVFLQARAHKTLMAGPDVDPVRIVARLAGVDYPIAALRLQSSQERAS